MAKIGAARDLSKSECKLSRVPGKEEIFVFTLGAHATE
jgi:hypothetical protein